MSEPEILFGVYPDPVIRYRYGDPATVAAVNPAFGQQFDDVIETPVDEVVDTPVEAVLRTIGLETDLGTDWDGESDRLVPKRERTAANGRTYTLRQTDTDDGGYLIVTDVSVYATRHRELQAENDRLDQFARTVSHDLRNPLEVACSRLEIGRETGDDVHFDKVEAAHDRITELIEDVLTLARSGNAISDTDEVDLGRLATDAWESIDNSAATLHLDDELGTATVDPERVRTVFENLFRNAITHGGSTVTVSVEDRSDGFVVADTGSGIPSDTRDSVFDAGVSTGEGSTGLGLAIVSEIATAHGWTVSATESDAGGAQFEFRFGSA